MHSLPLPCCRCSAINSVSISPNLGNEQRGNASHGRGEGDSKGARRDADQEVQTDDRTDVRCRPDMHNIRNDSLPPVLT